MIDIIGGFLAKPESLLSVISALSGVVIFFTTIFLMRKLKKSDVFFINSDSSSNLHAKETFKEIEDLEALIRTKVDVSVIELSEEIERIRDKMSIMESLYIDDGIKIKMEGEINSILDAYIENKLINDEKINDRLDSLYDEKIREKLDDQLLHNEKLAALEDERLSRIKFDSKLKYDDLLQIEYENSLRTKGVVLNLFIIINIGMLLMALMLTASTIITSFSFKMTFPKELMLTLSGLYVGFSAFIIYVIRFSNARILTVISLREDVAKESITTSYLAALTKKSDVNENDVAIMRTLMINRAQREQKVSHPYEIILQGVSGSNIQFKGGRLQVSKESNRKE